MLKIIKKIINLLILKINEIIFYLFKFNKNNIYKVCPKINNMSFLMYLPIFFKFYLFADTLILRAIGKYEVDTSKILKKKIRNNWKIIELGAAYGYFTIQMSKLVGDKGIIYSFEPNNNHFSILKKNIKLNNLQNVKEYNHGLGGNLEDITLFNDPGKNEKKNQLIIKNYFNFVNKVDCLPDFIFIDVDAKTKDNEEKRQEIMLIESIIRFNKEKKIKPEIFLEYILENKGRNELIQLLIDNNYKYEQVTKRHYYFY